MRMRVGLPSQHNTSPKFPDRRQLLGLTMDHHYESSDQLEHSPDEEDANKNELGRNNQSRLLQSGRAVRVVPAMNTTLVRACASGEMASVMNQITKRHVNPSEKDELGRTPLNAACTNGHIEVVKYLIEKQGVDPATCRSSITGQTPLHSACEGGHIKVVKYLVKEHGMNPSCLDDVGATPLHYARTKAIAVFLAEEMKCDVNHRDKDNDTPLHEAAYDGSLDVVKYLITKQHCDPACKGHEGVTPLHRACNRGHIAVVKYLINEQGVNPSCEDDSGSTPLFYATNIPVAKFLVEDKKCNINHRNKMNNTPLHSAARSIGRLHIVEYLITQHCDPACKGTYGETPLHVACSSGQMSVVKYLINEQGVSPSCENSFGATPLYDAENSEIAQFLVEKGCSVEHKDRLNGTPLHNAAYMGRLDVVKYLIADKHCDPACRGEYGRTPLHYASAAGRIEVVKYLIRQQGMNPLCKDDNGATPLDCARNDNISKCMVTSNVSDLHTAPHPPVEQYWLCARMQPCLTFIQAAQDLPQGWEAVVSLDGTISFIDHNNQTVTSKKPVRTFKVVLLWGCNTHRH